MVHNQGDLNTLKGRHTMRVICLSCGYKVDMDRAYDDYDGEIKCIVCGSILAVKTEQGKLKSVSLVKAEPRPTPKSV